jgi:hypothetical protein
MISCVLWGERYDPQGGNFGVTGSVRMVEDRGDLCLLTEETSREKTEETSNSVRQCMWR